MMPVVLSTLYIYQWVSVLVVGCGVFWHRFRLWNVLFVLVRLGTITLSVLTLWFVPFLCIMPAAYCFVSLVSKWLRFMCHFCQVCTRLVKTVTGKLVYQFPTDNRFSERITGYRIYRMSCRHYPDNADTLRGCECCRLPFSRNSSVVGNFWNISLHS